jgi:hypothetical protein
MVMEYVSSDDEELQLDYDEKCDEVVELQNELKAAKIEAKQLQMRMKVSVAKCTTVPAKVSRTAAVPVADPKQVELENFFVWLAQHACMDRVEELDVNLSVPIGAHTIHMQRVVQWPLTFTVGKHLRLSAPLECKDDLQQLLSQCKAHGKAAPDVLQAWIQSWELVPGDMETITQKAPEPVVLLIHKASRQGILVASWPTVGALEAYRALCSADGEPFRLGERVEVEYDGQWYVGTLHSLTATGKAGVNCDVDGPGVMTVAPLYRVRRHAALPRRARAMSDQGTRPYYIEADEHLRDRRHSN